MNNIRQYVTEGKKKKSENNIRQRTRVNNRRKNIKLAISEDFDVVSNMEDFADGIVDAGGTLHDKATKDFLRQELAQNFVNADDEEINKVIKKLDLEEDKSYKESKPLESNGFRNNFRTNNRKIKAEKYGMSDDIKSYAEETIKDFKSMGRPINKLVLGNKVARQFPGASVDEINKILLPLFKKYGIRENRNNINGRKRNLKETYYVGYGDTKGQKYYGLDEVDYIYRNNYEDPLLAYNGYIINSAYVDEALYDMFIEDTGEVDDYYYDQWVKENKHLIISTLDEIIAGYGFPNTFDVKYLIDHKQIAMLNELADEMAYDVEGNRLIFRDIDAQELLDYYGNKKFTLSDFYSLPYID